jgi:class 3 adenylate cyclase
LSFIETVERARALLERNGRLSLRALQREFDLGDEVLEDLVEELVDVQQIAAREGKVLSWIGAASAGAPAPEPETRATPEAWSGSAAGRESVEAERRQLTVLFCDLVDSTRLAAGLDPEDWREIVVAYYERAGEVVARFDGHVAQHLGDGVLVYFGYPKAHEDDAERAVRTGLEIVDAIGASNDALEERHGLRLALRVGIHTGLVVVGEISDGERQETLALGDTTNVAAHLQGEAESDTVVMSAATHRLVSEIFVTEDLGEHELKGLGRTRMYRGIALQQPAATLGWEPARGLAPPVGRDAELGLLDHCFRQVEEGIGQTVLISGEPGIGKSRVVEAFRERAGTRSARWLKCRASPYRGNSPLHPIVDLLRQMFAGQCSEAAEPDERNIVAAGFDAGRSIPLLAPLLGWPAPERLGPSLNPEVRYKQTLELLTEWLLALGDAHVTVLVVEDLHCSDPSTLALLSTLIKQIPRSRLMLIATFRPEFEAPWPLRSHVTPIVLSRLHRSSIKELIERTLRGRTIPKKWINEILRRSDGIPLFAEELTRALAEQPPNGTGGELSATRIPSTLQDSLMARLDALAGAKEIAQIASVLGREFSASMVAALAHVDQPRVAAALATLEGVELVYGRGHGSDARYAFNHALIREAAYESLLRSRRKELHRDAARLILKSDERALHAQPDIVAHHLSQAGEYAEAAQALERAAAKALASGSVAEAEGHYEEAIGILARAPDSVARIEQELELQLKLGQLLFATHGYGSDRAREAFAQARSLSSAIDDKSLAVALLLGLWGSYIAQTDWQTAAELSDQLIELADQSASPASRTWALLAAGLTDCERGRFGAARAMLERAVGSHDPSHHEREFMDPGARAYFFAARCAWVLGDSADAERLVEQGLRFTDNSERPYERVSAHIWVAVLAVMKGEPDEAMAHATRADEICETRGFELRKAEAEMLRGWALIHLGRAGSGTEELNRGFERFLRSGTVLGLRMYVAFGVEAMLEAGDAAAARHLLQFADPDAAPDFATCLLLQARSRLRRLDRSPELARADFERAVAVAREQDAHALERRAGLPSS